MKWGGGGGGFSFIGPFSLLLYDIILLMHYGHEGVHAHQEVLERSIVWCETTYSHYCASIET
jgi:hypothetical protein